MRWTGAMSVLACTACGLAATASTSRAADRPIDKLSVVQQTWRSEGGFLIADITFRNDNPFALKGVIVTCEIAGDKAKPDNNRGVTVRQVLPPGQTKVSGLEFTINDKKAQGGACRPVSADRNDAPG
jgi:hypothetical protein